MSTKRGQILIIMMVLAVSILLGSLAKAAELETVRLSEVVRSVFYAPQYVAIEKGFFLDEDIKIDLSTAFGADKGAAALISGSVDVGFFGPEAALYIYQQGAPDPIMGFAQLTQRDGSFLLARDVDEDFAWENVRGKTIVGARVGGVPQMVLEFVLKQHGIEPFEDVDILTNLAFETAVGAYQAGLGDYIAQFEPAISQVQAIGGGKVVSSLGAETGSITYTVYHAKRSSLAANPQLYLRFTKAILRGQIWVAEHSAEEIAVVITPYFPDFEHELLVTTIAKFKEIDAWPVNPTPSEVGFARLQEVMLEAGELYNLIPFSELMNTEIGREALGL